MPIYANYKEDDYVIPKPGDMVFKDIVKLKQFILDTKKGYMYKYDKEFNDSIQVYNIINLGANLATYDIHRTTEDEKSYIQRLEQFILYANQILSRSTYFKYKRKASVKFEDIKFDIIGSWTKGEIIILVKKKKVR